MPPSKFPVASAPRARRWLATAFLVICCAFLVVLLGLIYQETDLNLLSSLRMSSLAKMDDDYYDENELEEGDDPSVLPHPRKKLLARQKRTRAPAQEEEYDQPLIPLKQSDEETFFEPDFVGFLNASSQQNETNPLVSSRRKFVCLKDDHQLWQQRVLRSKNITEEYCDGRSLGPFKSVSRSVPVIFVLEQKDRDSSSRVNLLVLTANTAAHFNEKVYVLIFGPDMWNLKQSRPFRKNVRLYHYEDRNHPIYKAYLSFDNRIYVHRSLNAYSYEIVCFQRWFGLQKFVELKKMEMAYVIDYDVLLFSNVTKEMELCYRGCTFGAARTTGTFSSYWSPALLKEFVQYILRFYRGHMYERKKQVSDMLVLDHFSKDYWKRNPGSELCFDEVVNVTQGGWEPRASAGRKASFDNMIFRKANNYFYQDPLGLPFLFGVSGYNHYYPLKSLHFQGKQKKEIFNCVAHKNA